MWERFWQWLFPDQCMVCGAFGATLCHACCAQSPPYSGSMPVCGADSITIAYAYTGAIRQAILCLKYVHQPRIAGVLGTMLAAAITAPLPDAVIIPVPAAPHRVAARGYDQAVLLARQLAHVRQAPMHTALVRVRNTTAQARLTKQQRQRNVHDAFAWRAPRAPHTVILVDDVCTTGATLRAAIAVLRRAGTTYVHVAVVARGIQNPLTREFHA